MRRDLKIILNTNAPWANSGYAVWAGDFMPRMIKEKWQIAMSSFAGLSGSSIDYQGYKVYPVLQDPFGSDAVFNHAHHFKANVAMTMQDVWTLNPQYLQQLNQAGIAFIPYTPIDQFPVPPNVLASLNYAYRIITFSRFGYESLLKSGYASTMIYEGVDTDIFKPIDKKECREKFNLPQDKFIFGMIGANKENPSRKAWQEALEAFKLFHDRHPDSIFFYQSNQNFPGGFPIMDYAKHLGIIGSVYHLGEYISFIHVGPTEINELLNSFDVLMHASSTEGFGLVIVEAQAAGIPVIVNNYTSMPELITPETGWACEPGEEWFSPAQGYWRKPNVKSLHEKMEEAYKADLPKMGKAARKWVKENFDMDMLMKTQWTPFWEKIQEELLPIVDNNKKKE